VVHFGSDISPHQFPVSVTNSSIPGVLQLVSRSSVLKTWRIVFIFDFVLLVRNSGLHLKYVGHYLLISIIIDRRRSNSGDIDMGEWRCLFMLS
jgi:hypothetical protein